MRKLIKETNLYFILAEENLFHPHYFNEIIKKLNNEKYSIVGVTIAKDKYKNGFFDYTIKLFYLWGSLGFISIGVMTLLKTVLNRILLFSNLSVPKIALFNSIPVYTTNNVNSEEHLQYLMTKKIDIIISSNGQIFKDKLLSLPSIACINRHTALLPNYGGVLPVFWAMNFKEKKFGVSIHYMVKEIDKGKIITQKEIPIRKNNSLFANYIIGFQESVAVTIEGIEKAKDRKEIDKQSNEKITYYTFPTKSQMKDFRKNHKAFSVTDIYFYLKSI